MAINLGLHLEENNTPTPTLVQKDTGDVVRTDVVMLAAVVVLGEATPDPGYTYSDYPLATFLTPVLQSAEHSGNPDWQTLILENGLVFNQPKATSMWVVA